MIQTETLKRQVRENFPKLKISSIKPLSGGIENENFLAIGAKKYVVRIYASARTEKDIKNELEFITYLSNNKFPTPAPLLTSSKLKHFKIGKLFGALFPFISGKHVNKNKASLLQVAQLAKLVSKYHEISIMYSGSKNYRKGKLNATFPHVPWSGVFNKEYFRSVPHYSFLDFLISDFEEFAIVADDFFNKIKKLNHPLDSFKKLDLFTNSETEVLKRHEKEIKEYFSLHKFDADFLLNKAKESAEELVNFIERRVTAGTKCIIHYDYSDKNILFNNSGKIQALLDFDDSVYDYALFDLGNLALHWTIVNHRISQERLNTILSNYAPRTSKELVLDGLKCVLLERVVTIGQKAKKADFALLCVFASYAQKLFNIYEQKQE